MLAPLCGVSAEEVTFGTADANTSEKSITKDGVTISITDGTFNNGTDLRVYANATFTVSSLSPIIKMEMTCKASETASKGGPNGFSTSDGTYTYSGYNGSWSNTTGLNEIKFTASKQVQITSLVVTLESDDKTPTTLIFDEESFEFYQGDMGGVISNNLATLSPAIDGAVITYETDNTDIVTNIDNGVVTYSTEKTGIATITAKYAGDETYKASEAKYTINIKRNVPSGAENYVKIDGTDDFTGKYVMIGSKTDGTTNKLLTKIEGTNKYYTGVDVTLTDGNQLQEIPEDAINHAEFTIINLENGTDYTYAFYNTTTGKYINIPGEKNVTEVDRNDTNNTHASLNYSENGFDITFNTTTKYKFQYNPSSPRFTSYKSGQQPIKLFRHGYSRDVTSGNFGTLCLPYGGTISGATLYAIEGKQMENNEVKSISLVEVDKVEAGKPYIFQAAAEKLVVYYEGDIQATAGNDNGLLGSYNDTAVEAGKYVISNNTVKKCGEGSKIGKNRCYIDMDNVPEKTASAAALIINFNDSTDAIESIEANADSRNAIYDLSGRRVKAAQKGLYIVNGKKIIK